ncbi:unnamed protein product [Trichobilharzia szidati]|nr:unnamed protein product [Trichobilharzia szidati]
MVGCFLVSGSRKCRINNLLCQMSRYLSTSSEFKDYYAILNVKSTASQEEIKEAYLDLSKKYHPDRCNDEGSKMRFAEISEAYSILGKVESRREFDTVRKINAFGVSSDAFRMQYPKPPSDLDKVGLEAYENEMRRRWEDRLTQWVKAQGRYELERGIKMKPLEDIAPPIPLAERFSYMNSFIALCTFCIGTGVIIYSVCP